MSLKKYLYPLMVIASLTTLSIAMFAWATTPSVPDFSQYSEAKDRKRVFFQYFKPLIEQHNQSMREVRVRLKVWYKNRNNLSWYAHTQTKKLAREYGIKKFNVKDEAHWQTLLRRVDIVPTSLALAQAAVESAWGTSRFAREVHNYFGHWCFSKDCGLVPRNRDPGANHEAKGFDSPEDAVASYVHNLNTHRAYRTFRDIRARLRKEGKPVNGMALAGGLTKYSARGDDYIKELRAFMKQNSLLQYDNLGIRK